MPKPAKARLPKWQDLPAGGIVNGKKCSTTAYNTGNWSTQTCDWDQARCTDCKLCWTACPDEAIRIRNGKMQGVDTAKCKACALCCTVCPTKCLSIKPKAK